MTEIGGVEFEDVQPDATFIPSIYAHPPDFMAAFLIKYSFGVVVNKEQAYRVLLVFVLIMIILTFIIAIKNSGPVTQQASELLIKADMARMQHFQAPRLK